MCLDVLVCMYLTGQAVARVSRAARRGSSFGSLLAEGDDQCWPKQLYLGELSAMPIPLACAYWKNSARTAIVGFLSDIAPVIGGGSP
jgi:hypothetical protein